MFAPLEVPERDSPIIAATGEPAAIGAHLECMHRALMGFSHLYALPAVNIPPAQHSVTTSTDELLPTWTPGHCKEDGVGVVRVLVPLYTGTRGRIPQPDGIIPPATG